MAYYDEFPRTNFYQQDLGWLIEKYHELNKDYETLVEIYELIKKEINTITLEELQKWLDDGTIENIINEKIFSELNALVTGNTEDINKIKKELEITNDRKYVFIGDSYAVSSIGSSWISNIITNKNLQIGVNAHQNSRAGSGFGIDGIYNFKTLLEEVTITNKNEITDIVICGGYNDAIYSTNDKVEKGIKSFIDYVKLNFINAKIAVGFVGSIYSGGAGTTTGESRRIKLNNMINFYRNVMANYNVLFIDNMQYILRSYNDFNHTYNEPDNIIHPSPRGNLRISKYLSIALESGTCNIIEQGISTPTYLVGHGGDALKLLWQQDNANVTLYTEPFDDTTSRYIVPSLLTKQGKWGDYFTLNDSTPIIGVSYRVLAFYSTVGRISSGGEFFDMKVLLGVRDNKFCLSWRNMGEYTDLTTADGQYEFMFYWNMNIDTL